MLLPNWRISFSLNSKGNLVQQVAVCLGAAMVCTKCISN